MPEDNGSGFTEVGARLQAVRQQTQWINQQVGAGKLALQPEAAEAAAKHCEEERNALKGLASDTDVLSQLSGLGSYPSGEQLMQRFIDKAIDPRAGAVALLGEMMKELDSMAEAFRNAAKDYRATDDQIAEDMQRGMQ